MNHNPTLGLFRMLKLSEAAGYLGICPNTFLKMERDGSMPPRIVISSKCVRWDRLLLDIAIDALRFCKRVCWDRQTPCSLLPAPRSDEADNPNPWDVLLEP
jgi:predicted DNA-binding transcriptional regulator AlpA